MSDLSEIREALEALCPNTIEKVNKFKTRASIRGGYDTGLFLVTLLPGRKKDDLIRVKYLFHQSVHWEAPKSKSREFQCYRCQKWGHTARNCNGKFCCVKCDKDHPQGECLVSKDNDVSPSCVNCKSVGHTANFKGCPFFQKYKSDRNARLLPALSTNSQTNLNIKTVSPNSNVIQGKSYASNFYNNQSPKTRRPAIIEQFLDIAQYFGEDSLEIKIAEFLKIYKRLPKDEAKKQYNVLLQKVLMQYGP